MCVAYRASQSVNDYRVRPQRRPFDRPRSQQANKSESQTPSIEERKSFCIGRSSSAIINSHNGLSFIHGCRLFCPNRRESFTSEEDHSSSRAPAEPKNETAIRHSLEMLPHAARRTHPWPLGDADRRSVCPSTLIGRIRVASESSQKHPKEIFRCIVVIRHDAVWIVKQERIATTEKTTIATINEALARQAG